MFQLLSKKKILCRVVSFVLLMAFALSNFPRSVLHDAFKDHVDKATNCSNTHESECLHNGTEYCTFEKQLVTAESYIFLGQIPVSSNDAGDLLFGILKFSRQAISLHAVENKGPLCADQPFQIIFSFYSFFQ